MKNYLILLILFLSSLCHRSFAQEEQTITTSWASKMAEAEALFEIFQFEDAELLLKQAIQEVLTQHETTSPELAQLYAEIAVLYKSKNDLFQAEVYLQQSIAIYTRLENYNDDLANTYNALTRVLMSKGDMKQAKKYAQKGLKLKQVIQTEQLARLYNTLGVVYYYEGKDYEKALENFEEALQLRKKVYGDLHENVAASYNNVGVMHLNYLNNPDAALKSYKKAHEIQNQTVGPNHIDRADIYDNFGEVYAAKQEFQSAEKYRTLALHVRLHNYGTFHPATAVSYENLARDLVLQERYAEAIPVFEKSNSINTMHYGKRHRFVPRGYKHLAQAFLAWGKPDSALVYLQHAIIGALSEFDDLNVRTNPDLDTQIIYEKNHLLEVLSLKARIFYQKYEVTQQQDDLRQSLDGYNLAMELIDKLREEYERSNSKANLLEGAMPVYEGAITSNYELHKHSNDPICMENIFHIIEKSKSTLLLESLREDHAKAFAGIPESLISLEEKIQYDLFSAEKRLFEAQQSSKETTKSKIPVFKKAVRTVRGRSDSIISVFEQEYPDYHRLKYAIQLASIDEIKALLPNKKHTLIEYFVGKKYIYAFVLQQEKTDVIQIVKDFPLEEWITDLRKNTILSANPNEKVATETLILRAHELYKHLFLPIESKHDLQEELSIIPGGMLGYLPFEMLIKEAYEEANLFHAHRYLIQDYSICYNYSATLLKEMKERKHTQAREDFLAFAPAFKANALAARIGDKATELPHLEHNIPEVEAIQKLVGGLIYTSKKATKSRFLETAPNCKVVHLATHGLANDKVGDYAFLAFYKTNDTLSDQLLYNRDLYDLKLQADLVVLSACETGIGELQSGEGIISLARGFSYAGAKSILTTLWNINDAKTQELMQSFYTYLKAGKTKDAALRQAKLDFMEKYSHSGHPFYWASFVPVGDMQPIALGRSFSYWWLLLLGLPLVIWLFKSRL